MIDHLPFQDAHQPSFLTTRAGVLLAICQGREKRLLHQFLGQFSITHARNDIPEQQITVVFDPLFGVQPLLMRHSSCQVITLLADVASNRPATNKNPWTRNGVRVGIAVTNARFGTWLEKYPAVARGADRSGSRQRYAQQDSNLRPSD